jgi:hypothetical protein
MGAVGGGLLELAQHRAVLVGEVEAGGSDVLAERPAGKSEVRGDHGCVSWRWASIIAAV